MKKMFFIFSCTLLFSACTFSSSQNNEPGLLDDFAQCLTDNGAIFYGTEWCPHCKNQKAMFGNSMQKVNYIDCDKNKAKCQEAGITGYPTWKFADGSSLSGTQFLSTLAEKTGCTADASTAESTETVE
jgi:thiol-disulfide isomerase/thioredoxin